MLASLDSADVAAIQSRSMGKTFLRHGKLASPRANALTKDVQIRIAHSRSSGEW